MKLCFVTACAFAHLVVGAGFRTETAPALISPASVTVAGQDLIICDYVGLYRIRGSKVVKLKVPRSIRLNPASVYYRGGLLYVANYEVGNVLIFSYPSMRLVRVLTSGLTGPEGVYSNAKGYVDVADYDGSVVARFSPSGRLLWRRHLAEAKGITELEGHIYATSLVDRTVVELNPRNGTVIRTAGGVGLTPGRYLWPVQLASDGGALLVVDAHNGRVTRLSSKLALLGVVPSGNGPGVDLYDFPYGLAGYAGGWVVADTLKGRLAFFNHRWQLVRQLAFGADPPTGRTLPIQRPGKPPTSYTTSTPTIPIDALLGVRTPGEMVTGYNSLDEVDNGHVVHEFELTASTPGAVPFFYWTWARNAGKYDIIGSPEQRWAMVINRKTFQFGYAYIGPDVWDISGTFLRGRSGQAIDPKAIAARPTFLKLDKKTVSALVTSDAGKRFLVHRNLPSYLKAMAQSYYVNVPEVLAIRQLAARSQ